MPMDRMRKLPAGMARWITTGRCRRTPPGARAGQVRDLVSAGTGRQARPHLDELRGTVPGRVADRARQEFPVLPHQHRGQREDIHDLRVQLAVGREVILPA